MCYEKDFYDRYFRLYLNYSVIVSRIFTLMFHARVKGVTLQYKIWPFEKLIEYVKSKVAKVNCSGA